MRLLIVALLAPAGCAAPWRPDFDRLESDVGLAAARYPALALEPDLSGTLDVETLLAAARARNPELREALARTRAAIEEVNRAGALDDPMLRYRPWAVPLDRAYDLGAAEMNMVGIEQTFPFPGNLSLRGEAALRDAEALHQMYREKEREIVARVRKAYAEYFALSRELEIRAAHMQILDEFEKTSDSKFRTGKAPKQDVLKPQVELVMLRDEILALEQRIGSARTEINALLNRPPDAALGKPAYLAPAEERFEMKELAATAVASRPELLAAALRIKSSRAGLALAEREATWPDFSIGLDYMQVPGGDDAWGGMIGINLPWITGKRSATKRKMEHTARADEIALEAARVRVLAEVHAAFLRVEAARKSLLLFRGEILPVGRESVDVSRSNYEKDKASFLDLLDAERSLREIEVRYERTVAEYESARADLERAVGVDLRRKP
ncbi:MAG: TolC family protein [Planctomycetes bacterium]|nr:TolC family protein [Planctomycetota bacterium]